ncbi:haloacid dehalogenase [Xylariomycetidae sp. FL2044]|nr:haloacid dehalogenase [Xylariomycetidae sp. FL2044]
MPSPPSPKKKVIAFDLYGTLLSTESIAGELEKLYGADKAPSVAALWRRYQLEYTWRINSMGEYKPFDQITLSALHHAVAEHENLPPLTEAQSAQLMSSYDALHAFPEVSDALSLVRDHHSSSSSSSSSVAIEAYIFSNGTDAMVSNSLRTSPDLAGPHAQKLFRDLVTVEPIRCYKPDRRTYAHLVQRADMDGSEGDVWVVSANPFDIVGARAAGMSAAFIDRAGRGWVDRLDEARAPSLVAKGVDEAVRGILKA